jgi:hypothetical protein
VPSSCLPSRALRLLPCALCLYHPVPQSLDGSRAIYLSCLPFNLGKPTQNGRLNLVCIQNTVFSLHSKVLAGSVMHLRVYCQNIILLSSRDDCIELFEKRSNLYSDKPTFTMIDLSVFCSIDDSILLNCMATHNSFHYRMGWDFNSGLMPYGPRWRQHRRLFQQRFKKTASLSYRPEQTRKVIDMLHGLLISPEDFRDHAQT